MPDTTCHMSISLDGFVAGPDQSLEQPLGARGGELHTWHMPGAEVTDADRTAAGWLMRPRGAYVMGRNMFGPVRGEWDRDWQGWWGSEPPYHAPVFVLTHHAHDPIELEGGTTFHFVTEGFDAAYQQATAVADGGPLHALVNNAGGALGADTIEASDPADWQAMFDVNVVATLRVTQALLPALRASGRGDVLLLTSTAATSRSS